MLYVNTSQRAASDGQAKLKDNSVWVPLQGAPKEDVMKRNLIGILTLVAMSVLLGATGAYAQSYAKADVPFAFTVGSAQLPPGNYQIKCSNAGETTIVIQNGETTASAMSMVEREYPRTTNAKLVFHRVGNQYFLAEIWRNSSTEGMVIPTSSQEKSLEKELKLAGNRSGGYEEVVVALN
jgi:hypothetical protein